MRRSESVRDKSLRRATFLRGCTALAVAILGISALGKLAAVLWEPLVAWAFPFGRVVFVLVTTWEVLLAAWLASGVARSTGMAAGAATFFLFANYHLWGQALGRPKCDCFGLLRIPERAAFLAAVAGFFAASTGLILIRQTQEPREYLNKRALPVGLLIAALASACCISSIASVETEARGLLFSGRTILIEPEQWIGKAHPLGLFIEGAGSELGESYLLVIVRNTCERCHRLIGRLVRLSPAAREGVILLFADGIPETRPPLPRVAELRQRWTWVIPTPLLVLVHDGRVLQVGDERLLGSWLSRRPIEPESETRVERGQSGVSSVFAGTRHRAGNRQLPLADSGATPFYPRARIACTLASLRPQRELRKLGGAEGAGRAAEQALRKSPLREAEVPWEAVVDR